MLTDGNGVGPWWFPRPLRAMLTAVSRRFFVSASWGKHDEGYARGHPARAECDRKFLAAMLADAAMVTTVGRMAICTLLAWTFWALVRAFGWASYRRRH